MVRPRTRGCFAGRTSFCCCCSVRTGASVIGWFNFVVTSLYVGLMVFSLHHIIDELIKEIDELEKYTPSTPPLPSKGIYFRIPTVEQFAGSGEFPTSTEIKTVKFSAECEIEGKRVTTDQCSCEESFNFKRVGKDVCKGESRNCQKCIAVYVLEYVVPTMYKSLAIPGANLLFSIIWLTAVESRSLKYVRFCGYVYMVVIFLQTILQLCFLGFGNQKLVHNNFAPISWSVWLVFGVYAAINVYFIPTLYKYIKLREKEFSEGLEQGLLTSEITAPAPGRAMEDTVDAFAIDSDGEMDVFRYTAEEQNKQGNYGSNLETHGEVITTRNEP